MICRTCRWHETRPGLVTCDGCIATAGVRKRERAKRERTAKQRSRDRGRQRQLDLSRYRPLDEWLAKPSTRILRALRWFDGVTARDLWIALDVADCDMELWNHRTTLRYLVKRGKVVQERVDGMWSLYRLAPGVQAVDPRAAERELVAA